MTSSASRKPKQLVFTPADPVGFCSVIQCCTGACLGCLARSSALEFVSGSYAMRVLLGKFAFPLHL